ncbi:hypothetical protein [Flavobacterium ammonificans]|uniref:Uncharacterized protein n=1 Tax=Flavobacterium ammonificans TaxID=1751056 RepID=A0ABM7V001_9FLAO|nr:hypothetical protein [Flavobacterium ammonificans]BDB52201.1 hypothetical protein GENT11_05130 [Flavobacterium ammonificans]
MKKIIVFLLFTQALLAQTGIGTTSPNASARLEVASTDKGFLLPRMTAAQRGLIPSPANGLMVYQTDGVVGFYVNTGTSVTPVWSRVNMDWTRTGNDISYTIGNVSTTGNLIGGNVSTSTISGFAANVATITANYSITAADNGKIIQSTSATAITVTIPTGLPIGFNCTIVQMGSGQITFSGTYLNRAGFTKTASQYSVASIVHLGSNSILVSGEMSN